MIPPEEQDANPSCEQRPEEGKKHVPGALARDQEEKEGLGKNKAVPVEKEGSTGQHPNGQEKDVYK